MFNNITLKTILFAPLYLKEHSIVEKFILSELPQKYSPNNIGQIIISKLIIDAEFIKPFQLKFNSFKEVTFCKINEIFLLKLSFDIKIDNNFSKEILINFWNSLYYAYNEIENEIFKNLEIDYSSKSIWQSPLSFMEIESEIFDSSKSKYLKFQKETFPIDDNNKSFVKCLDNVIIGSSWDGTLAFIRKNKVNPDELWFLFEIVCLDWQNFDISKKNLLDLITKNDFDISNNIELAQITISEFYLRKLKIDPYFLCYDEQDIQFVSLIQKSWKRDDMANQALKLFEEAKEAFKLLHEKYQNELMKNHAKRQDFMNLALTFVGIISFIGTIASVLSFIDFQNMYFDIIIRIVSIIFFSILFVFWVTLYFKKNKIIKQK